VTAMRAHRLVVLAVAAAGLLAGGRPLAAQTSPVRGRVVERETGLPVAGAEVLDPATGGVLARTDTAGVFVLAGPIARVRVRRLGYSPRDVTAAGGRLVTVVLDPLPIALEAVVVTAARREQKLKDAVPETQLLSRQDIEQSGSPDVVGAVTQSAGIQLEGGVPAGAGVLLQGLGAQRVLILVDGQPLVGRLNGNLDLSRLPSSMVERVEVVRGPQSTLYGSDAMGGVVNIITRAPERAGLDIGVTAIGGSQGRAEGSVNLLGSAGDVGGALDLGMRTIALAPGLPGDEGTYARRWNAAPKVHWQATPGLGLEAAGLFIGEQQRYKSGQLYNFADNLQSDGRIGLEWRHATHRIAPTIAYSRFEHLSRASTNPVPGSDSGATDVQERLQGEVVYSGPLPGGTLDAGVVLRREAIRADRVEGTHRTLDGAETYAQGTWNLGALSLSPGVRFSAHEQWGTAVTPRVAALYRPAPAVALRASVGAGYRAPDFKELYYDFVNTAYGYAVMGNPALQPERSTNVSLGLEVVGSRLYSRVSAYDNRFRDFIDFLPPDVSGTYTYGNIAHGTTRGVEVQGGWAVSRLRLEAEYAYLDAKDADTGLPLLNRAAQNLRFTASGRVHDLSLSAAARYTGRTPIDRDASGNTTWRDPYVRLDLRMMAPMPWALAFTAGMDNVFDQRMGAAWPGFTGRQAFAGLTWRSAGRAD